MNILIAWLILAFAVWLTAMLLPGIEMGGIADAIIVAAVFGVLNWLLGWLLFGILGVVTLGLGFLLAFITRWIVCAILLMATAKVTNRIKVKGFGAALLGALIMSGLGTLGEWVFSINAV